jgi:hypothetical protein
MPHVLQIVFEGFLFGLVIALPFVAMRRYGLRVLLSVGLALTVYLLLLLASAHAGFIWSNPTGAGVMLGALCTAHLKFLWLWNAAAVLDEQVEQFDARKWCRRGARGA